MWWGERPREPNHQVNSGWWHGLERDISTVAQIFNLPYRRIEFCNA
jgi:hypothetical protein